MAGADPTRLWVINNVRPDDHIEWDLINNLLVDHQMQLLYEKDYRISREQTEPALVHAQYSNRCSDMHLLLARKLVQ